MTASGKLLQSIVIEASETERKIEQIRDIFNYLEYNASSSQTALEDIKNRIEKSSSFSEDVFTNTKNQSQLMKNTFENVQQLAALSDTLASEVKKFQI